ncbi:hypothetical protein GCM10029992_35590 [Glycomyces albus]
MLTGLLHRLGFADADIPADVDDLTTRFRSAVADRRVLLVLDDAASTQQVEALIPGTPSVLTLVTSRRDLSSLSGAHSVPLEPPSMPEAVEMLGAAVADRISEDEATAVAERCGRLLSPSASLPRGCAVAHCGGPRTCWSDSPTRTGFSTSSTWDTEASSRR